MNPCFRKTPLALFVTLFGVVPACARTGSDAWLPASQYLAQRPAKYTKISRTSRYLTMRDGVKIAIDVNLPEGLEDGEKLPTILRQTRYYRSYDVGRLIRFFTRNWPTPEKFFVPRGYAWVNVDVRGTGASFGIWTYPWSEDEVRDGAEVVDWIVKQPWSNGKVGSTGISYDGGTAEFLLANRHPAVKASAPQFTPFDAYGDLSDPGGIRLDSFLRYWARLNRALDTDYLPSFTALMPRLARSSYRGVPPVDEDTDRSELQQAVRGHDRNLDVNAAAQHTTYRDDAPWPAGVTVDASSPFMRAADISASNAALCNVEGWFDAAFANAAIKRFLTLKNPVRLVIGPWNHGAWQNASPYSRSWKPGFSMDGELLRFFDYYLKDAPNGFAAQKPILYFTMGVEKWKTADTWPPAAKTVSFYFVEDHQLSTERPRATDGSDSYRVDLSAGTGSTSRWDLGAPVNYADRRRADEKLLCYTTGPLDSEMEVTGHPVVTLYASSTASDGEFFAYLEDVDRKGQVTYVTEGELRAIDRMLSDGPQPYRQIGPYHSFKRADVMPLVPGEVADLTFEILPTSYVFKREHRIRLALAGADKDHFTVIAPAPTWHVFRDSAHASRLTLPVVAH